MIWILSQAWIQWLCHFRTIQSQCHCPKLCLTGSVFCRISLRTEVVQSQTERWMWSTKLCSAPVHLLSGHVALRFLKSPGLLSSHLSISSFHVLLSWPPATSGIVWVIHQLALCSQNMNFDAVSELSCVVWTSMNSVPLNLSAFWVLTLGHGARK